MGSADNNYSFILPILPAECRPIKKVNSETQTDSLDIIRMDCSPCDSLANRELAAALSVASHPAAEHTASQHNHSHHIDQMDAASLTNGNGPCQSRQSSYGDTVDHPAGRSAEEQSCEQLIYDYMNSNEQLDIRESSDEDNVEKLNRRVSEFFNENRLMAGGGGGAGVTENGNSIDRRRLFNVMAARRSCISINDKDEVIVLSRTSSFRTGSSINVYGSPAHSDTSSRRNSSNYKVSDHNCNNDDGDDSWTDEEGEESDRGYSLRRKW